MNLFWKRMFGGVTGTAKLEKREAAVTQAMKRYYAIEQSAELAEFQELCSKVKTPEFKQNKKMLQTRKYKDTEEYQEVSKFERLKKDQSFKRYLDILKSSELTQFLEFKQSPQYKSMSDAEAVKKSEQLQRMKTYERSKDYEIYSRYRDSHTEKEYNKLKSLIETEDFKKRVAFWSNPKRWETTEEYRMDNRYYQLLKNKDIQFYQKTDAKRFEQYKAYRLTFEDNFDWNRLETTHWKNGFYYKNPNLIADHSFENEKQANNGGHNVSVRDGILVLETKKEKRTAPAWHPKRGFIEKEFEYTSDVLQTAKEFRQAEGVFRAKIRCKGKIHHAFWLNGEGKLPHINVFHFDGKHITVGNANERLFDQAQITGLCHNRFYIYTLAWNAKELIWYINDVEVFRTSANMPNEPLYLGLNSFISEAQHGSQGALMVDWIRVYSKQ